MDYKQNIKIIELSDQLSNGWYPEGISDKDTVIKNMQNMLDHACYTVKEAFKQEITKYVNLGMGDKIKTVFANACINEDVCNIILSIQGSDEISRIFTSLCDDINALHGIGEIKDPDKYLEAVNRTKHRNASAYLDYLCMQNGIHKLNNLLSYVKPVRDPDTGEIRIMSAKSHASNATISVDEFFGLDQFDNISVCFPDDIMSFAKKIKQSDDFVKTVNWIYPFTIKDLDISGNAIAKRLAKLSSDDITKTYQFLRDIDEKMSLYYDDNNEKDEAFRKTVLPLFTDEIKVENLQAISNRLSDRNGHAKTTKQTMDMLGHRNSEIYTLDFCTGSRYTDMIDRLYDDEAFYVIDQLVNYGLANKKTAFLNLIRDNVDDFEHLEEQSIIFSNDFVKIFNVNELTKKHLAKLLKKDKTGHLVLSKYTCDLEPLAKSKRQFTFEEIETVSKENMVLQNLYLALDISFIDKRLITFRQLLHKNLRHAIMEMPQDLVTALAHALSKVTFVDFCYSLLCYKNSTKNDMGIMLRLMAVYGLEDFFLCSAIKKAKDMTDVRIIVGNYNDPNLKKMGLDAFRKNYLEYDQDAKWLIEKLNYTDADIDAYRDELMSFCMDGSHTIVRTYYDTVRDGKQKQNIILIASAAIQNKLSLLKYADFSKEIQYDISDSLLAVWEENLAHDGRISTSENDDFLSCISIGERTGRTCMSYNAGAYNECCLATFDGNKKVIYAMEDGEYVGRAILRLTKYSDATLKKDDGELHFMDVTKDDEKQRDEQLILFLEKMYYNNTGHPNEVRKQIIALAKKKAKKMGLDLIVADDYQTAVSTNEKDGSIYVSKSKNGLQYLDSFGGSCHHGGFYKSGTYHFLAA